MYISFSNLKYFDFQYIVKLSQLTFEKFKFRNEMYMLLSVLHGNIILASCPSCLKINHALRVIMNLVVE